MAVTSDEATVDEDTALVVEGRSSPTLLKAPILNSEARKGRSPTMMGVGTLLVAW